MRPTTPAPALAAALAVMLLDAPAVAAQGLLPYRDAERVAAGQAIYAAQCAACHGADLEGQPEWRARDADGYLPAPPHDETGHTWHHPDALLIRIVTEGTEAVVGGGYRSTMMGFGDVLSAQEIRDVLAYIKSTWPEEVIEMHDALNARAPG
jgi:mono/diheme cytochrome c family protein